MAREPIRSSRALAALPLAVALALAACGEDAEPTYETDVVDESGGELIVAEETPAIQVDLPETPMTPVPPGEEAAPAE